MPQVAPLPGAPDDKPSAQPVVAVVARDRRVTKDAPVTASSTDKRRRPSRFEAATTAALAVAQAVAFGPVGFALAWTGIVALHAVCAAYLVVAGRIYLLLETTQVSNMFELYQLTLEAKYFPAIAYVHYVLAGVHVYLAAQPIAVAVIGACVPRKTRERLTASMESIAARRSSSVILSRSFASRPAVAINSVRLALLRLFRRVYRVVLARDGLFGVQSDHFELFFLTREVVETLLQTYQGYMMARLMPRARLNGFYTLILVVNCWTTPLLRRVCRGRRSLELLLAVLCDIVLDFVSSIGVPVAVALEYIKQYDPESTDFAPWTLYYDDVWLLNFMNEAPIVIFGSWLDAASRLVFSLGLLSSMEDIKALITRQPRPDALAQSTAVSVASAKPARRKSSRAASQTLSSRVASSSVAIALKTPEIQATISKWVHRMMVVWGLGIAVVYLEAYARSAPTHCSLALRPWLVTKPACAVVNINCLTNRDHTGTASDWDAVFSTLDAGSVEYVTVRHCPHVEIAPPLLTFRNLYGFKTYNSTIQRWGEDAAFTSAAHPRVRFAFFIATQFPDAELPRGLLDPGFPTTLTDIEIAGSNLQFIPSRLPWPQSMTLFIESAQIAEFPMALARIKPYTLSLAFNKLTSVPAAAIMEPDICKFTFRGNPIAELPATGVDITQLRDTGSGMNLFRLSLEYTNISALPDWVTERFVDQVEIRAAQTPLCNQILLNESSAERERLLAERPWLERVARSCRKDPGPFGFYPVYLEAW